MYPADKEVMRFKTRDVEVESRIEKPRRINNGEYTDPPPWPNIEKINAMAKDKPIAINRVELISINFCAPLRYFSSSILWTISLKMLIIKFEKLNIICKNK